MMTVIEEVGGENDLISLENAGTMTCLVVQAPVPPRFADKPSVDGTNDIPCLFPFTMWYK